MDSLLKIFCLLSISVAILEAFPQSFEDEEAGSEEEAKYSFTYDVQDDKTGTNYHQEESRDGDVTQGFYSVLLPDTRIMKVTYSVDGDSGFLAQVTFEGEAQYPEAPPQGSSVSGKPSGSSGASSDSSGKPSGSPGTSSGSSGKPSGSPGTSTGSTGTSTSSSGKPSSSPGTSTGSTGTSTGSSGKPSGSSGKPSGSTGSPAGSPDGKIDVRIGAASQLSSDASSLLPAESFQPFQLTNELGGTSQDAPFADGSIGPVQGQFQGFSPDITQGRHQDETLTGLQRTSQNRLQSSVQGRLPNTQQGQFLQGLPQEQFQGFSGDQPQGIPHIQGSFQELAPPRHSQQFKQNQFQNIQNQPSQFRNVQNQPSQFQNFQGLDSLSPPFKSQTSGRFPSGFNRNRRTSAHELFSNDEDLTPFQPSPLDPLRDNSLFVST